MAVSSARAYIDLGRGYGSKFSKGLSTWGEGMAVRLIDLGRGYGSKFSKGISTWERACKPSTTNADSEMDHTCI